MKSLLPSLSPLTELLVLWRDPTTVAGWHPLAQAQCEQAMLCRARGALIEDRPDRIIIAMLDNDADQASETFAIPKSAIVEMWELRPKKRLI